MMKKRRLNCKYVVFEVFDEFMNTLVTFTFILNPKNRQLAIF